MYYMGFTYREAYTLPKWQVIWFIERIQKEMKKGEKDNNANMSRALDANHPAARDMMGRDRGHVPSRLRRFT